MLLLVNFILFILIRTRNSKNIKHTLLVTVLLFFGAVVLITESLSLLNILDLMSLLSIWTIVFLIQFLLVLKGRKTYFKNFKNNINHFIKSYKLWSFKEKGMFYLICTFFTLTLIQGLLYPPNNWDSLTYHMSRIMHWIGNESVSYFPTHTLRQLYQPPFSEYIILNLNLINGNDYLANSVQWLFLIFSLAPILLLLDFFKVSRFNKFICIFLLITIPAVELQASTTKNDIVCGFFILSVIYCCINAYYTSNLKSFSILGLCIGLGFLTKGTSYLLVFPILLFFLGFILYKILKTKQIQLLFYGIVAIVNLLAINSFHYSRNFSINKSLLNIDDTEAKMYSNEKMNIKLLSSNILKNTGLHLGYPIYKESDYLIKLYHNKLDIDIDSPENNYSGMNYQVSQDLITHEDGVCNTTHLLLFFGAIFSLCIASIRNIRQNANVLLLLSCLLIQFIIFSGFLKWQPWHTRLHIPLFMIATILISVAIEKTKFFKYILILTIPILVFSFYFFFVYNNLRPIINNHTYTKTIKISDSRFKNFFANQPNLYAQYSNVLNRMYQEAPKKVGVMISDWEYPLFHQYYYDKIEIKSINVGNVTNSIPQDISNIDAIISTMENKKEILFNNKKYINKTPNNEQIWYYTLLKVEN